LTREERGKSSAGGFSVALQAAKPDGAGAAQLRHAEPRIIVQKLMRRNFGSLSASTSALTLPNVVSGLL
jgi:hypothetical protein